MLPFVNLYPALSNRNSLLELLRLSISVNPILLVREVLWHDSVELISFAMMDEIT